MVLICIFLFFVAVQVAYALYFFRRILSLPHTLALPAKDRRPVSVIICAKNEGGNLKQNLPVILEQRYSNEAGVSLYEVIVVNDASDDDTAHVLMGLEQYYGNLWDVIIPGDAVRDLKGKRYALREGVNAASYDWLVFIDADCVPLSDVWLEKMVAPLAGGKEIVAGYGGYHKEGGLLNAFIQWETMHTFLQYSTYILAGKPYMAVGRNMACTRQAFRTAVASPTWNALQSGDDDLLVSIAGNRDNVAVVCDELAFTITKSKATWGEWVRQKQRHLSTGKYYKTGIKGLLGLYGASHAGLWLAFFAMLFSHHPAFVISVMLIRCVIYWGLWAAAAHKLRGKSLIFLFPFFDIAWMVYNFALLPYITWKDKKNWK